MRVDCHLLTSLSARAVRRLHAGHHRLRQAQLVRVAGPLADRLGQASADLCLAPTFGEAAQPCNGPFVC